MTDQLSDLIHFSCNHCATELTVPQAMAGVSGPCPTCATAVTAPERQHPSPTPNLTSPTVVPADMPSGPHWGRCRRSFAYAGLCAAVAGVAWSAWKFTQMEGGESIVTNTTLVSPVVPPAPADPKIAGLARSTEAVKKFLATSEWSVARSMIAEQDIPGTDPSPAYLPGRFQPLVSEGKFTPVSITTKENAGQFQVIWEIQNPHDAEKLVMTADDTPDGVRIRWYQPPYFVASRQGTNVNGVPAANLAIAQATPPPQLSVPAPAPAPEVAPPAAPAPAPKPAPPSNPTQEETILAAAEAPPSPSNGSAALNNAAAKVGKTTEGTAAATTPTQKPKTDSAPR